MNRSKKKTARARIAEQRARPIDGRNSEYTPEMMAMRGELVSLMLHTVAGMVEKEDLVHALVVGIRDDGTPRIFHSYGDLSLEEVAKFLGDLATMAKVQAAINEQEKSNEAREGAVFEAGGIAGTPGPAGNGGW